MTQVFLHDPMGGALGIEILGAAAPGRPHPTECLAGYTTMTGPHGFPLLVPRAGGAAAGRVAEIEGRSLDRLRFCLAAFGGRMEQDTLTELWVCVPADGTEVEEPRAHVPEAAEHLAECVAEVMAHHGRLPAVRMPEVMRGLPSRAFARVRGARNPAPTHVRLPRSPDQTMTFTVERPYAAFFGIEEHLLSHRRFDGTMTGPLGRAVFVSGDAVTVLPVDPRRREVLLIEQFRAGPFARRDPVPWCLEAVAGRCDPGEAPEAAARREAVEEAGLVLGRMEPIAGYYTSPGCIAEYLTAFVGEADLGSAGGVHGLADEHEDIRAVVLSFEAAFGLVASGEANNGPLLVSLLWLERNHERLCADWARGAQP